jgi:SAM-dependent methyltransferase
MRREDVVRLYDRDYAAIYDESFLTGEHFRESTEFEVELIKEILGDRKTWLDVGCGTGYLLSRFPRVERFGLDLSPAMLEIASKANPGVGFCNHDFRDDVKEWRNRWDLVSCTWFAYCYVDTVTEVESVLGNMARWTSPGGTCFLPVCDPDVLCKTKVPYSPPADSDDGSLSITGVVWTWTDLPSGRKHVDLVAPHLAHMVRLLEQWFSDVRLIDYPAFTSDCLAARRAIIATGKLSVPSLFDGVHS